MTILVGSGASEPCPICDLKPVGLREVPGFVTYAECVRCAMTYAMPMEGSDQRAPVPAATPTFLAIFRLYWKQTQRKLGAPPEMLETGQLDAERMARVHAFDEWIRQRPALLASSMAPATWPFVSITAVIVQPEDLEGETMWSVIAPPQGLAFHPMIPFPTADLPVGTVVTIQIPIPSDEPAPTAEPPERKLVVVPDGVA